MASPGLQMPGARRQGKPKYNIQIFDPSTGRDVTMSILRSMQTEEVRQNGGEFYLLTWKLYTTLLHYYAGSSKAFYVGQTNMHMHHVRINMHPGRDDGGTHGRGGASDG